MIGKQSVVPRRVVMLLAALFLAALATPVLAAGAAPAQMHGPGTDVPMGSQNGSDQVLFGVIDDPDGEPLEGITLVLEQGGSELGTTATDGDGAWELEVPEPGTFDVVMDLETLPDEFQPQQEAGERREGVLVRPGRQQTRVPFPLISADEQQDPAPGSEPEETETDDESDDPAAPPEEEEGAMPTELPRGASFVDRFLQLTVEGIKLGAIIAITAVGLSLVFGTTRLINFAHGELVTIGAVSAFFLSTNPGNVPLILAAGLAMLIGAAIGAGMEKTVWLPMRKRGTGMIQLFIISIGLSLLLRYFILVVFGSRRGQYDTYTVQAALEIGSIRITPRDLIVTLLAFAIMIGIGLMLSKARIGKAMRAVSDNKDLAEASGINVNRVIFVVWALGGGLAALGGVFYGLTSAVYWDMGFYLLLLMFAGVILGGIGSAYGAMVGSLLIGLVSQWSTLWFPPSLQNLWALLVLILVLLLRPQGIFGRAERAG